MSERAGRRAPSVTGFDFDLVSVDDYDRYRPTYAPASIEWIMGRWDLSPAGTMVELAAGTGKLTRGLVGAGLAVIAVEPSMEMRGKLARVVPEARLVGAAAEAIPLTTGSADAVGVGQAFHHFHAEPALHEIHRILRPGGGLALFWNVYEHGETVHSRIDDILDRYVDPASAVSAAFGSWPKAFEVTSLFEADGQRSFPHPHHLPSEHLATVMATSSDVASLPDDRRAAFLEELRALSRALPSELVMPAETRVDLYRRT